MPRHTIEVGDLTVEPVWSDSLGAKSTCCRVETPDTSICVDPGVAAMQPSYPLADDLKGRYREVAREAVESAVDRSEHVAISHYHFDHYAPDPSRYGDATLWLKDPNQWINDSQWHRAREFLRALADHHGADLETTDPRRETYPDPYDDLDHAREKDFGDYQERREELLSKWRERFWNRVERWTSEPWVCEPAFANFADDAAFTVGDTTIRFLGPLFHGIEYARTGWVLATVVETPEVTFLHSSDLQGPVVEDYADRIVDVDPDVLFLDGPATYLLGPMLNRTNLQRSVDNAARIVREVDPACTWFDHHLLRETQYRERTETVWDLRDEGYAVQTVAEFEGQAPLVDLVEDASEEELRERVEREGERVRQYSSNSDS
ncbi:hypothetical protein [Halospeciosus flavus]|uniref:UPF0282 protein ACFQJ9_07630 n=1 Tax=Halospeciosus flavus TaxID=3032283 RepID=A0ABD5Z2S3_9EURY|nr:hypothetical protein [Halospeciosus flavus]